MRYDGSKTVKWYHSDPKYKDVLYINIDTKRTYSSEQSGSM